MPLWVTREVCFNPYNLYHVGRKEIRELGMTLVIGARRKLPPVHLYKALLMAQVAFSEREHTRQGQQNTHTHRHQSQRPADGLNPDTQNCSRVSDLAVL